ncbi:MAG TPA: STAS domain-containing protein [Solirubrobacterales bacterium]|nr:STAS domain-containing protein [Solirubrobacterales bacterium]
MIGLSDREVRAGTLTIRTHRDGSACTVALAGELDLANAGRFSDELKRAENDSSASRGIVVDMTELEFIDSTGIAILVALHQRLNADGDHFKLVRSQAMAVCRVLALTGLDEVIPFQDPEPGEGEGEAARSRFAPLLESGPGN